MDLGTALDFVTVAEGAELPRTGLTFSSVNLQIGRMGVAVGQTDIARLTNAYGQVDVMGLGAAMANGFRNKFTSQVAGLSSGFSNSVGSTGVNLSVTTMLTGMTTLELNAFVGASMHGVFHGQQLADFRDSLRSETGPMQYIPATQEQVLMFGSGFRGRWGPLDLYSHSRVPTANAGADYLGMILADGAIHWRDGVPPSTPGETEGRAGALLLEYERNARGGDSGMVASTFLAVGEREDLQGVGVLSDS